MDSRAVGLAWPDPNRKPRHAWGRLRKSGFVPISSSLTFKTLNGHAASCNNTRLRQLSAGLTLSGCCPNFGDLGLEMC